MWLMGTSSPIGRYQHARLHSIGKEKEGSRTSRLTSLQGWQGHERRIWTYFDTCSLQTEWYRSYCIIRSFQRQIERACSKLHYCLCLNISLGHIRSSEHHSVKDKVIIGYFKFPIKEEASIPYQLAHHHRHSPCHNRILSFVPLGRLLHLWFWDHLGKFNLWDQLKQRILPFIPQKICQASPKSMTHTFPQGQVNLDCPCLRLLFALTEAIVSDKWSRF